MAEGARLESVFTLTGNLGSNPSLSAIAFIINNIAKYYDSAGYINRAKPSWSVILSRREIREDASRRLKIRVVSLTHTDSGPEIQLQGMDGRQLGVPSLSTSSYWA